MAALPDKDKLLRNFSRCANWEEKYLYIIELGQRLAPLSPEEHSVQNIIQGCQSQVWIVMDQFIGVSSPYGRWVIWLLVIVLLVSTGSLASKP